MNIELQTKLLKLKGYLNEINHISYSYAQLGKNNPFNNINDGRAEQLITAYEDLLVQVKNLIMNYEQSGMDKTA